MSAKPESADAGDGAKPAKSKKLLVIVLAVVLVLVLGAVGAYIFVVKQRAAAVDGEEAPHAKATVSAAPKTPPSYLPMDNMVVNLADPGGERVAQVGITLEVVDAKAADQVKAFMPTIRSGVLMLVSQRTAEELLKQEGKEKLAKDILRETAIPFGGGDDDEEDAAAKKKKKNVVKAQTVYPVVGVLFSSFIIQ